MNLLLLLHVLCFIFSISDFSAADEATSEGKAVCNEAPPLSAGGAADSGEGRKESAEVSAEESLPPPPPAYSAGAMRRSVESFFRRVNRPQLSQVSTLAAAALLMTLAAETGYATYLNNAQFLDEWSESGVDILGCGMDILGRISEGAELAAWMDKGKEYLESSIWYAGAEVPLNSIVESITSVKDSITSVKDRLKRLVGARQ